MPQDKYYGVAVQLSDPANEARPVTPSDTTDLQGTSGAEPARSLYVGTGGTIVMMGTDDTAARTFTNVPSGAILPFRAKRIMATGTTATGILALY